MTTKLSNIEVVHRFFSGTGLSYDRMVTVGTCGFDLYWKRRILAKIPDHPARILDQACGTGILTLALARRYPACQVTGVELRDEYLDIARAKTQAAGLANVDFVLGRAEDLCRDKTYDCITSSYLAKYAELDVLLTNTRHMLNPGGVLVMHDFTYPPNRLFAALWRTYMRLLKLVGSRYFPEWRTVFDELPGFVQESEWLPVATALLKLKGFAEVECEWLTFGTAAVLSARQP